MSDDQRALLDECTTRPTCAAQLHLSGCPASPAVGLLAALGRAVERAREDRRAASAPPADGEGDTGAQDHEDGSAEPPDQVQGLEVDGQGKIEHGGLQAASRVHVDAEESTPSYLPSCPTEAADQHTWERRVPGTDVPLTRVHLAFDETGRALVHEAVLAQLLADAGWERAQ
ncbi:hypothetical protein [Nocardioides sp. Arc9.136]|uniref:hypothetical protein n=1 Tax=Nocardioides sp. Arc9.136 TaxID=2996826 RepID=UPI0026666DDD|nr:hypothetical protein [Nocardioides sp. Arc9.136]WKN47133.1 hypothetical protein OSR43_13905 [Nocardioides sp. Arc9.136]